MLGVIAAIAIVVRRTISVANRFRGEGNVLARMLTRQVVPERKSHERVVLVSALVATFLIVRPGCL